MLMLMSRELHVPGLGTRLAVRTSCQIQSECAEAYTRWE